MEVRLQVRGCQVAAVGFSPLEERMFLFFFLARDCEHETGRSVWETAGVSSHVVNGEGDSLRHQASASESTRHRSNGWKGTCSREQWGERR